MRGAVPQPRSWDAPSPRQARGGWAQRCWDGHGRQRGWWATPEDRVRPRQARCQASSCSRRRAGGGPGAPRSPAAADANLCPPAQQAAGGLGAPAGLRGWGGVGTAGPPWLTWHCRLCWCTGARGCSFHPYRDRLSWHVTPTPPTLPIPPPCPCCPQFLLAPLSVPQIPIILNKHPHPPLGVLVNPAPQ